MEIYAFRLFGYSFLSLSAFWWKSSYFCFSVLPTLRTFAGILVRTCLHKRIHMSYEERFWEILRQKAFSHSGRLFFFGLLWRRRVMIRLFCQLCSNYLLFCMYSETGRGFSMFMSTAWYVRLQSRKEILSRRCDVKESSASCFQDRLCGKCGSGRKTVTRSGILEYRSPFLNKIYIYYITKSIIRQWFIWNCV